MSVAGRLADWCAAQPRAWPEQATARARSAVEDTVAVMVAGSADAVADAARKAAPAWGLGNASIVGDTRRLAAPGAAFVNGTAAHALDFDDILLGAFTHASAVLVPALLALAEERRLGGAELLDAYIVGLEMQAAVSDGVNVSHYLAGWHSTSTLGTIGTAAGCARLLGLDADGIRNAISLAVSMASGAKVQFGTMAKPMHAGLGAMHAVQAALLAEAGMQGHAEALEGKFGFLALYGGGFPRGWDHVLDGLGRPLVIERLGLAQKRHPCCGSAHNTLDCVLDLKARHGFAAEDVDAIDALVGSTNVRNLMYGVPENEMQARFSMPYVVSAALLRGRLSLDDFTPEAVLRPELAALMPRVRMTGRDPKDEPADIKDRLPHLVSVRLKNGQVLEAGKAWPRGSIQDPFTEDDRRFKFEDCVVRKLGPNAARDLEQELRGLDRVSDFGPLMAHLA
jgi:2-methylcitrate dehydratase PrpD